MTYLFLWEWCLKAKRFEQTLPNMTRASLGFLGLSLFGRLPAGEIELSLFMCCEDVSIFWAISLDATF